MMMIILFSVALVIGIYFYTQKSKTKTEEPVKNVLESFIPSDIFVGAKKGYIFKNDSNGIGYYLDKQ
tara:strand:- start:1444 stop:1644 length:201 start_codon:yes stop_codon:yes gene_type:complete